MIRSVPLPLAPPPYPAEALHSWLHRVAATYSLKPRQLLHAVGVRPFAGPIWSYPKGTVQSALETRDLKHLAYIARCDVSQLGLASADLSDWLLLCDDWLIVCPRCIRANLLSGASPYERATWRWASRSFCPRHQIPLVQVKHLPDNITECDRQVARLNDTENLVARDLIAFERDIARAHRGIAPPSLQQSLTAPEFLQVLKDLTMFAVKRWNVGRHPRASCVEQHARMLTRNAPSLFDLHLHKRSWQRGRDQHVSLTHIPDPAIRRAAIWLAMEVIRLPPTPRPKHDLRLGFTAQDDFFGYVEHEGWEWLAHQAQAWPILYRSHYWEGFTHAEDVINLPILLPNDTVKGTDDIVKGSE